MKSEIDNINSLNNQIESLFEIANSYKEKIDIKKLSDFENLLLIHNQIIILQNLSLMHGQNSIGRMQIFYANK